VTAANHSEPLNVLILIPSYFTRSFRCADEIMVDIGDAVTSS
jgi:hypothetical protein